MIKVDIDLDLPLRLNFNSQVYNLIGMAIYSHIKENFVNEKDVKGKRFAPLKSSTIKQKQRQGKIPYKILRDTGQLLNSLNYKTINNGVVIGYDVPYAIYHEYGTRKMAQRKILPTDESEIPLKEIESIVLSYLKGEQ